MKNISLKSEVGGVLDLRFQILFFLFRIWKNSSYQAV
jgi:hypothetical protein